MAHISRPAKHTIPTYHIITREPKVKGSSRGASTRRRLPTAPLPSRSSSSSQIVTPKALVQRKSTNFDQMQPSFNGVYGSQSLHGNSRASTPRENKVSAKEYFGDWGDGHITVQGGSPISQDGVTIRVNRPSILHLRGRSRSNDWEVVELSDTRLVTRASSVGDLRKEDQKALRGQEEKIDPSIPKTDLAGLTTCMRLESHLRYLTRILRLYLDFDERSNVYSSNTVQEFLGIIHGGFNDISHDLKSLTLWNSQARDGPAYRVSPLLETTAYLQDIWKKHMNWIAKVSDRSLDEVEEGEFATREYLWQQRQDACVETTKKMLGLLGSELIDGLEDVDKNEAILKNEWIDGPKERSWERNRKQWMVVVANQ